MYYEHYNVTHLSIIMEVIILVTHNMLHNIFVTIEHEFLPSRKIIVKVGEQGMKEFPKICGQ